MAPKVDYVFTRDYLDNNRINLMHSIWTKSFGYTIHPKIPTKQPDLRVADVGTGTGIWLLDARDALDPSAQLEGFDISFDAAPPAGVIPTNVSFRHWDVHADLPADLAGVFDIVHVRFLSFVLRDNDIPAVVQKLFKMLKPGGYLQWGEADMETLRFEKRGVDAQADSLTQMFKLLEIQDPRLKPTWAKTLAESFITAGFVDVEADEKDCPPHWAFVFHECGLMIHELIYRKTKNTEMQQNLGLLLPKAVEETRNGAYGTSMRVTTIGKKPQA
ncbi:hypothetical protein diail_10473 [Diaporthe ilicicola]|nr:hypothetical protein diail_10473 [Diaporthe ilicicola]